MRKHSPVLVLLPLVGSMAVSGAAPSKMIDLGGIRIDRYETTNNLAPQPSLW